MDLTKEIPKVARQANLDRSPHTARAYRTGMDRFAQSLEDSGEDL